MDTPPVNRGVGDCNAPVRMPSFDRPETIQEVIVPASPPWLSVQTVEHLIRATAGIPARAVGEMRGAVDYTVNLVTAAKISAEATRIAAQMMTTIDGARTALLGALAFERFAPAISQVSQSLSTDPLAQQTLDWVESKLAQIKSAQEAMARDIEDHLPENRELIEAIKLAGLSVGRLLCSAYHLCSESFTRANIIEACKMIVVYATRLDQHIAALREDQPDAHLRVLLRRANAAASWLDSPDGRAFTAGLGQKVDDVLEHVVTSMRDNQGNVEPIVSDLTVQLVAQSINRFSPAQSEHILDCVIERFKEAIDHLPPNTKRDLIHRGLDVGRLRTGLIKRLIAGYAPNKASQSAAHMAA